MSDPENDRIAALLIYDYDELREIVSDLQQRVADQSQMIRDSDTVRIRMNHARIEAEEQVATLTAELAARDQRIARLTDALEAVNEIATISAITPPLEDLQWWNRVVAQVAAALKETP